MVKEQQHRLAQVFKSANSGLLAFVRSRIQSLEESEDLVQDVYLQALRNLNVLEAVDNLTSWLYTVTKNKVIDWYRKKKVPMVSIDESIEENFSLKDILAQEDAENWDIPTRQIVSEEIIKCLDELPEKQRLVFVQNVSEGKTFRELAEETGESINTLLARKRYAVQFLQTRLKEIKELINEI